MKDDYPVMYNMKIGLPAFLAGKLTRLSVLLPFVITAMLVSGYAAAAAGKKAEIPSPQRQTYLVNMVREDCGSCHGLTLRGGLGPSLLPQALRSKDADSLVQIILNGRAGTPMPPWKPFLSEAEAEWIVEKLLQGFPNAN